MILRRIFFECAVLIPSTGECPDRFDSSEGWLIERVEPGVFVLERLADPDQQRKAIAAFTIEGWAAVYEQFPPAPGVSAEVSPMKKARR